MTTIRRRLPASAGTGRLWGGPAAADQIAHRIKRGRKGGRPPAFDAVACKDRNTTERASSKLKAFRAVAMRTDKRDYIYRGTVDIATIKIWLRDPVHKDP